MTKLREQVSAFHKAFGVIERSTPGVPVDETVRLRLRLIAEEFNELLSATLNTDCGVWLTCHSTIVDGLRKLIAGAPVRVDLPETVDALGDLQYVIQGSYLACGVDDEPITDEIHASNLTKLGADGKPVMLPGGKVGKGPSFRRPDLRRVLVEQGWIQQEDA